MAGAWFGERGSEGLALVHTLIANMKGNIRDEQSSLSYITFIPWGIVLKMCGIAGIIDKKAMELETRVRLMIGCLSHRGPDDEGFYKEKDICLAHRRLVIIDLTKEAQQPMIDRDNVLVFNGEIYNYHDLRKTLVENGIVFHSKSDTEVLLHGYRLFGDRIVKMLRGMFSFALWDGEKKRLFCARDPFGKKPFYFYEGNGKFVFASEIEAVVKGLSGRPGIDFSGISYYLRKGYFPPGQSVYQSIGTLKAGHCLEVDLLTGC